MHVLIFFCDRLPLLCEWEGNPENIVFEYPYVIAFDPQFIEVHHVDTVSSKRHAVNKETKEKKIIYREILYKLYLEINFD